MDNISKDEAIRGPLLEAFAADEREGGLAGVERYQARFPGWEDAVARVYGEYLDDAGGNPASDSTFGLKGDKTNEHGAPTSAGAAIGPFTLIELLGSGGQASVYRARDSRFRDREVAVKLFHRAGPRSQAERTRFRREAEIAASLDHPSICPILDAGLDDSTAWIAMKLIDGRSLTEIIADGGVGSSERSATTTAEETWGISDPSPHIVPSTLHRVPPDREGIVQVVRMGESVARGLQAAHEKGVIHRDIKPGNVMVTSDGTPVLVDFGLSRRDEDEVSLTNEGDLLGTPAYMSPEQVAAHRITLDQRTDIYSLGVTLYEALTHRRPFAEPSRSELYAAIQTRVPESLRNLNPAVSRDLELVVQKAMEKDRERRYATAAELADDLERLLAHQPVRARPTPWWVLLRLWAKRNPTMAWASCVFLIGVLSTAFFAWRAQRNLKAWRQLADVQLAGELVREAEHVLLSETDPTDLLRRIDAWLLRAEDLRSREESIAAVLATFREARGRGEGQRYSELEGELERIEAHERTRKAYLRAARNLQPGDPSRQRITEILAKLDRDHEEWQARRALLEDHRGWVLPSAEARYGYSAATLCLYRIRQLFCGEDALVGAVKDRRKEIVGLLGRNAATWEGAVRRVRESAKYHGLVLRADSRLIPLGPDPDSGLEEFALGLGTGVPPVRTETGKLSIAEETGLVFVLLPGGAFDQPVDPEDAKALVRVTLDPFLLSKYEMTQGQWARLTRDNPSWYTASRRPPVTLLHPVEQVSARDADLEMSRAGMTLPTEAQWKFACALGLGGKELGSYVMRAQVGGRLGRYHVPVDATVCNTIGLWGMFGNVSEWCLDPNGNVRSPKPETGNGLRRGNLLDTRVLCGFSFEEGVQRSIEQLLGTTDWNAEFTRLPYVGVRPVISLLP